MTEDEYNAMTPQQKYHYEKSVRLERNDRARLRMMTSAKQQYDERPSYKRGRPKGSKNAPK